MDGGRETGPYPAPFTNRSFTAAPLGVTNCMATVSDIFVGESALGQYAHPYFNAFYLLIKRDDVNLTDT